MKRILALILAVLFSAFCFVGCSKIGADGKGAVIDVYLGTKVMNLDPAIAYTDENAVSILNLIFEGLFRLDDSGSLEKALCKKYSVYENDRTGKTEMKITIRNTHWSDGSEVQANDIVFAWRRILSPDFSSPAAAMLFPISGAQAAKLGEISIYDVGVYASAKDTVVVEFEDGADPEEFLLNLASPALVPLRENKISTYPDTWSRASTDLSTNGPFRVKKFSSDPAEVLTLQRSKFYYLNQETKTEAADKFVTPYQINVHYDTPVDLNLVYSKTAETDVIGMYQAKELFYLSGLTQEVVSENRLKMKTAQASSTFSYLFNCNKAPFNNSTVRYAFSIALDRDYLADLVGMKTKPATSLLPSMVFNTGKGTSFQKKSGNILPKTSQIEEAKQILADAGIKPSSFGQIEIYYRVDSTNDNSGSDQLGYRSKERAIAQYTETVWEELGFKIVLKPVSDADMEARYNAGNYDVIAVDFQAISPLPFYSLAQFSAPFSGSSALLSAGVAGFDASLGKERYYVAKPFANGYSSASFDALIADAYAETNEKKKASLLHEAEEVLLTDGGICPILFNTTSYVSQGLSGLSSTYWGTTVFTKANLKNYEKYLDSEE